MKQGDFESGNQVDFVKLFNLLWLFNKEDKNPVIYEPGDGSKLTVLDTAAFCGHVEIIKGYKVFFRFNDTELNPSDDMGRTPLFWAVVQGHLDVAKFYVENGYNATGKIFDTFVQRMSCDIFSVARTSYLGKIMHGARINVVQHILPTAEIIKWQKCPCISGLWVLNEIRQLC